MSPAAHSFTLSPRDVSFDPSASQTALRKLAYLYTVLFSLSLRSGMRGEGGGQQGGGWESMAQLTNVRLRVRADNSIDRCCSTDTAYPFQPHREGRRGWLRLISIPGRVGGSPLDDVLRRGRSRDSRGGARGGCGTRRRPATVALQRSAALTLRSLTFPDDPR